METTVPVDLPGAADHRPSGLLGRSILLGAHGRGLRAGIRWRYEGARNAGVSFHGGTHQPVISADLRASATVRPANR